MHFARTLRHFLFAQRQPKRVPKGRTAAPSILEPLEARIAPAFTLTLSGSASANVNTATASGTTTFTASGHGANLNWQDVENAFLAGNNVVITSGSSGSEDGNIIDSTAFTFASMPANKTFLIQSGAGANLVGNIAFKDHSFGGTNESITLTAANNLTVGNLDASANPLASGFLVAVAGKISGTGIVKATNLALGGTTGIGSSASPFGTAASNLVAKNTTSGGIFIANTGDLNVGFASDPFQGIADSGGASDAITLTNVGSINITRNSVANEIISAPGPVSVTTTGATADILTGESLNNLSSGSNALKGSVVSVNSDVSVNAGRDLLIGNSAAAGLFGNVLAGGNLTLQAGRNITLDSFSFADASAFSTNAMAGINATAGGNISLQQSNSSTGSQFLAKGGAITLTTGAAGTFTANAGNGNGDVANLGGPVTIFADNIALNDTSSISTTSVVSLKQVTDTRAIDLGTNSAGTLGLTDTELHHITAGTLRIGNVHTGNNPAFSGGINVSAPLTTSTGFSTLTLLGDAGALTETVNGSIAVTNLHLETSNEVNMQPVNQVSVLSGIVSDHDFSFTNGGGTLTIGTVDGLSGINAGTGDVFLSAGTAAATGILVSASPNDNFADVTGKTVTLSTLGPSNGNTGQIGFFTGSAQFFEVSATTINASTNNSRAWISAIGGAAIGTMNVGTNTLFLRTFSGDLTGTHTGSAADITAAAVNLSTAITSTEASFGTSSHPLHIQASTLAANNLTAGGEIHVEEVGFSTNLTVTNASTTNGDIALLVDSGSLAIQGTSGSAISAPGHQIVLSATNAITTSSSAGVTDAAGASLLLGATSGIGASAAPLHTQVKNLEAQNTTNGIFLANTGSLTLGGITGNDTAVTNTGSGAINISTTVALEVAKNVSAVDSITLVTSDSAVGGVNDITVDSNAIILSHQSYINLQAGDDVNINDSALLDAENGGVALRAGFNDTDSEGAINLAGSIAANTTVVLLIGTNNAALAAGTNAVSETGNGNIFANGLALFDQAGGQDHPFSLYSTGSNNVRTFAALTEASVLFSDNGNLTVGFVAFPDLAVTLIGVDTSGHDAAITTSSETLHLTQSVDVGTAALGLQAAAGITQDDGASVYAGNLGAASDGNIDLTSSGNHIAGVALKTDGAGSFIHLHSDADMTVGSVAAFGAFVGATGIKTNNGNIDVILNIGGDLLIQQPITTTPVSSASTAAVRISVSSITETGFTSAISTHDLEVLALGAVSLQSFSNLVTNLTIADSAPNSAIQFTATGDFHVASVANDSLLIGNTGISSNNGVVLLSSEFGAAFIDQPINSSSMAGGGTASVTINGGTGVTLNSSIQAPGGAVFNGGPFGGINSGILIHSSGSITSGSTIDLHAVTNVIIDTGATLTAQGALTMEVGDSIASTDGGVWRSLGTMNAVSITITGGPNNDVFIAPADGKVEHFDGGDGINTYIAPLITGDVTVTDAGITSTEIGNDTFTKIQVVNLAGNSNANHIDASGFSGFSVISGGGGTDKIDGASVLVQLLGASFISTDGDAVTLKLTKGSLTATDVRFVPNAGFTGADLQLIDFHGDQSFAGTKLKITAKHTKTGGDGLFDVGAINAAGVDLGAVTIPGDLGQIDAGSGSVTTFALASLTAHSLGVRGLANQSPGGSLESDLLGKVGPIKIAGNVDEASIRVTGGATPALGSLASITVGGNLAGGQLAYSGAITASGKIGSVSIKGAMIGGLGSYSGSIVTSDGASIGKVTIGSIMNEFLSPHGILSDGLLGAVKINGSIVGGDTTRITISAKGTLHPGPKTSAVAIAGVTVGGTMEFADILAGYATDNTGVNADVQIGAVSVSGDWISSNIVAGVLAGADASFGTADDALIGGGNSVIAKIAKVTIKGQALGLANSTEHFGIVAQQVGSLKTGSNPVPLKAGASNDITPILLGPLGNFTVREV